MSLSSRGGKGKRPGKAGKKSGSKPAAKRRKPAEDSFFQDDRADTLLGSDAEPADAGEESDSSLEETAEEKRLRLAKAYLAQLRQDISDEESGGEEGEDGGHDALSERLRKNAMEAMGHLQRRIAHRVRLRELGPASEASTSGRLIRCHRLPVTALALTSDDRLSYSVSKDGQVVEFDIESGARTKFSRHARAEEQAGGADWVAKGARQAGGQAALLAAAVSSDGLCLAVAGGDKRIHVWDTRSRQYVQAFPGHKDVVSGLAFRDGTHELYSASFDRTVKLWSLDDKAYVDTLYGHQAEVLSVDLLRQERCVTSGLDHTCRVWKVPEESQLIFRARGMAIDCCRYITSTEWVTGSSDGALALWSQLKKKPVNVVPAAHRDPAANGHAHGAGSIGGDAAAWVGAVAVCRGTDLVASGAADGVVRLWGVEGEHGGKRSLSSLGGLSARGFVNALQIARSGRFVLAGLGQEPRLGRWARDPAAKNGLLLHELQLDLQA